MNSLASRMESLAPRHPATRYILPTPRSGWCARSPEPGTPDCRSVQEGTTFGEPEAMTINHLLDAGTRSGQSSPATNDVWRHDMEVAS